MSRELDKAGELTPRQRTEKQTKNESKQDKATPIQARKNSAKRGRASYILLWRGLSIAMRAQHSVETMGFLVAGPRRRQLQVRQHSLEEKSCSAPNFDSRILLFICYSSGIWNGHWRDFGSVASTALECPANESNLNLTFSLFSS